MNQLHQELRTWGAQFSADHFSRTLGLCFGMHLQRAGRGQRQPDIGRIDGFCLQYRSLRPGSAMPLLQLGESLQVEPVVLVRVITRVRGRVEWSKAPQKHNARSLDEWRVPDPELLRRVMAELDHAQHSTSPHLFHIDPELCPEKGR